MKKWLSLILVLTLIACCTSALAWGESNADLYEKAIGMLRENQYSEAGRAFAALGSYSDSPRYTMYCNAIVAGETGFYSTAVENLKSLTGFLDSSLLAVYYAGLSWEAAENYEKAKDVLSGITLYKDVSARIAGYPEKINARDYRKADADEQAGRLESALSGFKALGYYSDSPARAEAIQEKINARDYAAADRNEQNGKLMDALQGFTALGSYLDSRDRAAAVQAKIDELNAAAAEQEKADAYAAADLAEQNGDFASAYSGFRALGDYKDSAARAALVQDKGNYAQALQYAMQGKFSDAYRLYSALGEYEDSAEKAYVTGVTSFASRISDLGQGTAAFQFHGVWGIIDVTTNTTASPNWDEIGSFNQYNLAQVQKNGMYGYINRQGQVIIPCEFYSVSSFDSNGLCTVTRYERQSRSYSTYHYYYYGLYDQAGKMVSDTQWRILGNSTKGTYDSWGDRGSTRVATPNFSDGKIRVMNKDGLWGFIDLRGKLVGQVRWTAIGDFSEGMAAVAENEKYGYIDPDGNVVIEPQYSNARIFSEGQAWVQTSSGLWQCIDKENNVIIPAKYSQVTEFRNGLADVELPGIGWQIIDAKGELVYFKTN